MVSLIEVTRWYGPEWRGYGPQCVPTPEELVAAGAVVKSDNTLDDGESALGAVRDSRTWYIDSPRGTVIMLFVPDERGFYIADEAGDRWRPASLAELQALLREVDGLALSGRAPTCVPEGENKSY